VKALITGVSALCRLRNNGNGSVHRRITTARQNPGLALPKLRRVYSWNPLGIGTLVGLDGPLGYGNKHMQSWVGRVPTRRASSQGFTLLELMMAVVVLAVALVMAVPAMTTMAERRQTMAAVERIYSELQQARSLAVARSQPIFMNINPGDDWALGISNNALCDPADNVPACSIPDLANNNPVTHRFSATDNDNVRVNASGNQITFFSQRGTATPANIVVSSLGEIGYVVNILVRPLGQISICSPNTDPSRHLTSYRVCG
jgi:prepilin-type N-terminal cleavage/methylation domain-containing protein